MYKATKGLFDFSKCCASRWAQSLRASPRQLNEVLAPSSGLQSGTVLETGCEEEGRQITHLRRVRSKIHCDNGVFGHH